MGHGLRGATSGFNVFFSPPTSAPPFLLAGFVSRLGRRRSWVGRLHGPTRRRAQVRLCFLLLRGGFSLDADAGVRQRLYDSLAIDASDAGVSRPADEISSWVRRDF